MSQDPYINDLYIRFSLVKIMNSITYTHLFVVGVEPSGKKKHMNHNLTFENSNQELNQEI